MDYLKIRNWESFQHYRDRCPPWIKLHYGLMTSMDWVSASDATKLLAVVCMLVGSRHCGSVPNDPEYLKRVAYLDKTPNLLPLIKSGFLLADASNMLASDTECLIRDRDREETDTEERRGDICAAPLRAAAPPATPDLPAVITVPLNDGTTWSVTKPDLDRYTELYPGINVMSELRKLVGWNEANRTRLKTRRGVKAHINSWLSRAQDRAGGVAQASHPRDVTAGNKAALEGALRTLRGEK